MTMDAVESIQHSGDAFKRVFPLLAADHAQTREQLRTSPFPNPKRLADILDDDPAIRRRQDQIYNIRLQTSRTVVALVDVDRTKELHAALAAVTYKGGFELVNIDDDNSSVRLCDCCKDFLQNPAFETGTLDAFQSPVKRRPTKNHHDTFFQLMDCCYSSRPGCRLCQALWRNFEIQLRKVGHCFWHDGPFNLYIKRWEGSNMSFIISNIMRCINASSASSMTQFRLYDADEMEWSGAYPHSKLGACTNSETAFEQIRKWLDACFEKHSYCRGFLSSSQTPTRLVHINWAKQKIQVLESMDANTQYVALSYRWGDSQSACKLTAKTKLELTSESGVSMDRLPKTIYDACSACNQLGYDHLWIDRLCIVQDCTDDWAREASKMSQVHRNSVLTISASCCSDDSQGLFTDRSHRNFQPLHLRIRPSEMEAHKTMIIEPGNRDEDGPKGMLGHLANRGWVFQERILSRRTVYYTKEQILWECSTLKASELWPEGKFHDWSLATPYHRDYYPGSKPSRRACEGDCRCGVQMLPRDRDKWQQIVMDYTKRVFTFEEDRLPGLSGLATDFKKNHRDDEDEYYAGLWKSNIIEDLCWSAGTPPPAIPTKYRAPSWSWASLESKITYHRVCAQKPMSLADIKAVHMSYASDDCHGAVCDGWHLSGHIKPVAISLVGHEGVKAQMRGPDNEELGIFRGNPASLDRQAFGPRGPMFCLPLMRSIRGGAPNVDCLLLVPKGATKYPESTQKLSRPVKVGATEFQRVGRVNGQVMNETAFAQWLSRSPKQDILIC